MNPSQSSARGLRACLALVAAAFLISFLAWLVNVELAIEYASAPTHSLLGRILPRGVYDVAATVAVDMSTVSTFLPMLLLGFIASGLWWKLSSAGDTRPMWADVDCVPFPAHFPSFCFWCGLGATLYGLIIGLPDQQPNGEPIAVQEALATLIVGFKTAVISTLVGMACAGVSIAVSSCFRKYLFPPVDPPTLAATIDAVRQEFDELKSVVISVVRPFSQLHEFVLQTAAQFESCAGRMKDLQNTVGIVWFQQVLQQLADHNATAAAQIKSTDQIYEFLLKCQGDALSQKERDDVEGKRHDELIEVLSEALATQLAERLRFSRGLHEGLTDLADRLRPSNNGSPKQGVSR